MATQAEAMDYITTKFNAEKVGENFFKILVEIDTNRSQLVFAGVYEHVMTLNSQFASEEDMTAKQALTSVEDGLFGIKAIGGLYYISNVLFVEDLDASEINKGIIFLAKAADDLEKSLVGGDRL